MLMKLLTMLLSLQGDGNQTDTPPLIFPEGLVKVVGGSGVLQGEIPWQVSIHGFDATTGRHHFGSGSIVSEEWLVTAAHLGHLPVKSYKVRAGSLQRSSGGSVHSVTSIRNHEGFVKASQGHDIAVWKVFPPFNFSTLTKPVLLPPQGTPSRAGEPRTLSGWGNTQYGGPTSKVLLKAEIHVVELLPCRLDYHEQAKINVASDKICAGAVGKDSCEGDSGGPLFLNGVLYGVVSSGHQCGRTGLPGLYTEVASYREWLEERTRG